jgi:regulator of cell morphogenesis and NO signaling
MVINPESKVADVVKENIRTADIFKRHNIDFCCGGGVPIAEICERKNLNAGHLIDELQQVSAEPGFGRSFNKWEIDFLTDYIIQVHHAYVADACKLLDEYMAKVARVHGERHPVLLDIAKLYGEVRMELLQHMQKEERILFPYIKQLAKAKRENLRLPAAPFGTVENPVQMMEVEHEQAGEIMRSIARLTVNYTPPEWACNTFKALYAKLDEFEKDLHQHVHLENNILFPKAIEIEQGF